MADLPIPESLLREAGKAPPSTTAEPGSASRLAEIGGKKLAEGVGAAVGAPSLLLGMLYGLVGESYGDRPEGAAPGAGPDIAGPAIKEIASKLMQAGQLPIDLARRIFGKAPEAETTGERVVGAVAENVGAAAVPFGAGQVGIALKGGRAAVMQTTGFLSRLATLPPAKLAATEAAIATGAGVGQAGARGAVDSEMAGFVGQLVGAFGTGGALALVRQIRGGRFTQAGAKLKVGRELAEAVPEGSPFEKNLEEALALKGETGIQPSTAAATQSPGIARLEGAAKAVMPSTGIKLAEQEAASSAAIQRGVQGTLGAPGGQVEAAQTAATQVLATKRQQIAQTAETLTRELDSHITSAQQSTEAAVAGLGNLGSREAAGEAISNALTTRRMELKSKVTALFDVVDDAAPLRHAEYKDNLIDIVARAAAEAEPVPPRIRRIIGALSGRSDDVAADISRETGLALDDPRLAQVMREQLGITFEPGVRETTEFGVVRRWRSGLLRDYRSASRSVTPNESEKRLLAQAVDWTDKLLDQAGESSETYRLAAAEYRKIQQQFAEGTVAAVLQRGPRGEEMRTKIEDVAGAFFRGSAGGGKSSAAADFVAAVGDVSAARKGLRDYALRDFLTSAYDQGVLNTKRGATWLRTHDDVLSQFPEVRSEMQGLMQRGRTYDDVVTKANVARPEIERIAKADRVLLDKSALTIFTKGDPDEAVRLIMGRADAAKRMVELTSQIGGDAVAMRGLRQGVWDFAKARITGPNLDATGNLLTEPTKLRAFLGDHEAALRVVYTPAEMTNLKTLARAAELSVSPSPAPGGIGLDIEPEQMYKAKEGFSRVWTAVKWVSPEYVVAEATAKAWWRVLHNIGAGNMRRLYDAALSDPEVTKALLDATRKHTTEEQAIRTLKGALLRLGGPPAEGD